MIANDEECGCEKRDRGLFMLISKHLRFGIEKNNKRQGNERMKGRN
jgi:hypothetical protein